MSENYNSSVMLLTEKEVERFHRSYRRAYFGDRCWEWDRNRSKRGYGRFTLYRNGKKKRLTAHRTAWELRNGRPVPEGLSALHRCDNPPCVRPAHLFLGTAKDNSLDMYMKGRGPKSRLSPEQVREIRKRYAIENVRLRDLGARYGVSGSTVQAIVQMRTWTWLSDEPNSTGKGRYLPRRLDAEVAEEIRRRYSVGDISQAALGAEFGITTVHNILHGKGRRWAEADPASVSTERLWRSKLCAEEVAEIRRRYALGATTMKALAAEFGVSRRTVGSIVAGTGWKSVGGPTFPSTSRNGGGKKLSVGQVQEIRRRYAEGGVTMRSLGAEYGVTGGAVYSIVRRRRWRSLPDLPALPALPTRRIKYIHFPQPKQPETSLTQLSA